MLIIKVGEKELFDSETETFFHTKPITIRMEHSLMSISKWESHWEKPFLGTPGVVEGMFGYAEELYYIKSMILGTVPDNIPKILFHSHGTEIRKYISKKHTATVIKRWGPKGAPSKRVITTELVYYWMIKFGIPMECEKWHFNRLLMLIDVCNIKETPKKDNKLTAKEAANYMNQLNRKRRGS